MRPPGIRFEDLPQIDIILLTHNHYDHLDIKTMKKLAAKFKPAIYSPLGVGKYLERKGIGNITEMDWWDEAEDRSGIISLSAPRPSIFRAAACSTVTGPSGRVLRCRREKGSIYYSGRYRLW